MGYISRRKLPDGVNHSGIPHVLSTYLTVAWIWVRSAGVAGDGGVAEPAGGQIKQRIEACDAHVRPTPPSRPPSG